MTFQQQHTLNKKAFLGLLKWVPTKWHVMDSVLMWPLDVQGIHALDWSHMYKFIASGGLDHQLKIWNPYSQAPLATLSGHLSSIVDVVVNDRYNQIISLGSDKTIKVLPCLCLGIKF